ncbi:MAG: amidohydrolase [Lachnospiraceae bacterium]|nr:amidohydrolase [Lachnospiraceae bacterium]
MEKNKPVFSGEIWVKNEKIAYIATQEELQGEWARELPRIVWDIEIDCKDNLLMPGFKNAHTHSAMTFLRSYADDVPLDKWLNEKVFPLEAKLSGEDIYHLTRLAVLEYLTSGITSIFEMYLTPDTIAEACLDMGMRCVLTSGLNNFSSSIEQLEAEYLKWNKRNSLISYQLGFHAEYTCSKELIYNISQLAHEYRAPVYTHLSETAKEVEECKERYGMTPIMFLDTMGIFEFGGGGYHCVHVTDSDMEVLRRRRMYVITNPASNLKLASGIAPIAKFDHRKIPVAIGTDGPASNNCLDMFREMFLVAGLSRVREGDASSPDAMKVLRMATVQGARAMRLSKADVLAKGKYADIIMIDLHQPNMQPIHNIPKNLVYSGSKSNVCMTMINGKILYRNGEFNVGESIERIYDKCDEIVKRLINS